MGGILRLFGAALCAIVLAACGEEEQAVERETSRPVKTMVIGDTGGGGVRNFPARIEASRRADVSFRVPGRVVELLVKEGEQVDQGQLLAKLDPASFQTVVNERQAQYDRLEKDYWRVKELIKKGFISRRRFDEIEADFGSATAELRQAKLDLSYTQLKAPFPGEISRRTIERFEEVKAKQPVFALRDMQVLDIKFDVPEQIMIRLSDDTAADVPDPEVFVAFDARADERFPVEFKEIATAADQATRTFEATYSMQKPGGLLVLPGMTANVSIDLSKYLSKSEVAYVPVEAVVATDDPTPSVWVVDEKAMTVAPRSVKVGSLRGGHIAVTEGLKVGDRIVVAGVPFLVENMKVSLVPDVEQAVERTDDAQIRRAAEKRIEDSKKK